MDYQQFNAELQEAGKPIWEDRFHARMAYKYTFTEAQLQHFGMPTIGDDTLDSQVSNEITSVYLTIDQLVEHFRIGTPVTLPNRHEIVIVYNTVKKYLEAWHTVLRYGVNIGPAPIEDLLLMDRFASTMYEQVCLILGVAPDERPDYAVRLGKFRTLTAKDMFSNPAQADVATAEQSPEKKHRSFAQEFAKRLAIVGIEPKKPAPADPNAAPAVASRRWR